MLQIGYEYVWLCSAIDSWVQFETRPACAAAPRCPAASGPPAHRPGWATMAVEREGLDGIGYTQRLSYEEREKVGTEKNEIWRGKKGDLFARSPQASFLRCCCSKKLGWLAWYQWHQTKCTTLDQYHTCFTASFYTKLPYKCEKGESKGERVKIAPFSPSSPLFLRAHHVKFPSIISQISLEWLVKSNIHFDTESRGAWYRCRLISGR